MTFKAATYTRGVEDALNSFGVRVASEMLTRQRMPDGPDHLGAEWLSKTLRAETESYSPSPERRQPRNLDRPTRWSNPTSIEAAGFTGAAGMGASAFGGV